MKLIKKTRQCNYLTKENKFLSSTEQKTLALWRKTPAKLNLAFVEAGGTTSNHDTIKNKAEFIVKSILPHRHYAVWVLKALRVFGKDCAYSTSGEVGNFIFYEHSLRAGIW